ncbi:MAG: V-type ATP synthase subunit I [Cyclobacteriaceae bacterium]
MKKISLLVFYKEREEITEKLQELGVIHLETEKEEDEHLTYLLKEKEKYHEALEILKEAAEDKDEEVPQDQQLLSDDADRRRDHVLKLKKEIDQLNQLEDELQKEHKVLQPWGEFDWGPIARLKEKGLEFHFFVAPKAEYHDHKFAKETYQFLVSETKSTAQFVVLEWRRTIEEIPFERAHLPTKKLSQVEKSLAEVKQKREQLRQKIGEEVKLIQAFEKALLRVEDEISYHRTQLSYKTYAEGKILHLMGWIPVKKETEVTEYLDEIGASYIIEDPEKGEEIPVILENRKYSRQFEPITKLFQLPNYYEFDLTPLIAVFYPIFFAYCLGDSGYGLVILTAAIVGRFTFLKNSVAIAHLGIILGVVSIFLGIIKSGTVFGIPIVENQDVPLFAWLSQYMFIPDGQEFAYNAFNVSLLIGLFQIIVAIIIAMIRKIRYQGFIYALATFGKLLMVISLVVLFLGEMQGNEALKPYVQLSYVMLGLGTLLVIFFHDPDMSVGKRVGGSILPIYFILTGLLGDTLSYIRLFALGVASSILGLVVNQIGNEIMSGGGFMIAVAVLFLIFGHSLNLAMASLGAFVHPLRLTFVEFYNNAEFQGGGLPYEPFRKRVKS